MATEQPKPAAEEVKMDLFEDDDEFAIDQGSHYWLKKGGTTDYSTQSSCNMSSSQSKRTPHVYDQSSESLTNEELEELRKFLPPSKKLMEGRMYIRKTKKRAGYWVNFLQYLDENKVLRAECKFCDSTFAADSNFNGTKNIKQHSDKCIRNPANLGKGIQSELIFKPGDNDSAETEGRLKFGTVNLTDVREALIYHIVVDELPFRHVEKLGFKRFMEVCVPRFKVPSRTTVARDILQLYKKEKDELKRLLSSCQRVSVTTDTWTSIQRINYMCLTVHFIDNEWKLQKRILNFCPITSHKGKAIGQAVESCLKSWGIEDKLFTLTVDNASSNNSACDYLREMVRRTGCISDGEFLHVRCMAHIINLIVWDGINEHCVSINRVRTAVKYVRNSPARLQRFKELVERANLDTKALLSLDCPTRWNSTYVMLETAVKFERVFSGVNLPNGENVLDEEKPPNSDDWSKVRRLVVFLRGFYSLTRQISGTSYCTSNKGFFGIASTLDTLNKWEKNIDVEFQNMAASIRLKYDKYWGSLDKMNMVIYLAVVLDPHSKLDVVELALTDMYGKDVGEKLSTNVKARAKSLFDEYRRLYCNLTPQTGQNVDSTTVSNVFDDGDIMGNEINYVKSVQDRVKRLKGSSGHVRSEFERYLNEVLGEEENELDALSWWALNEHRYPIVSRMARDILSIPLSTVASESSFSAGGRHLDSFRSSLNPLTVQALICTQDWLRAKGAPKDMRDMDDNLRDLRELEEIENDICQTTLDDQDNVIYIVDP